MKQENTESGFEGLPQDNAPVEYIKSDDLKNAESLEAKLQEVETDEAGHDSLDQVEPEPDRHDS